MLLEVDVQWCIMVGKGRGVQGTHTVRRSEDGATNFLAVPRADFQSMFISAAGWNT